MRLLLPLLALALTHAAAAEPGAAPLGDLETAQLKTILADVDMLALISKDDAPVFMFTSHPGGDVRNRGHYLHHPNHAREVKKACDAAGVPATAFFAMAEPRLDGDYQIALREFLLRHVKAPRAVK